MRNLKKVLSLALALVMLLGMMVVGAGAATSFKDDDEIQNKEAVAVLVGMGIMKGREDGSNFEPAGTLTRAEAAKMIAQLDLGVEAADALKANGTNPFSDVWSGYWAGGAIDYCVEQGYINGDGAGHFFPNQKVTGVQFASMLLRLLGYDAKIEGLVGDKWAVNAAALARKAGLTTKVLANNEDMTRDGMAQMAFNTLTASMVEYEGMDLTIGEVAINARVKTRTHTGNALNNNNKTYDGEEIKSNITPIRFCEERFPDLGLVRDSLDNFGREFNVWTWKKVNIANSESKVTPDAEFTKQSTASAVNSKINSAKGKAGNCELWVNGKLYDDIAVDGSLISKLTQNGRQVQVYLKDNDHTAIKKVVVVDTYVARVNSISKDGTDDRYVTVVPQNSSDKGVQTVTPVLDKDGKATYSTVDLVKTKKTASFAAGDLVTYTAAYNGKTYDIQDMDLLEIATTAKLEKWQGTNVIADDKGDSNANFTADGTKYEYSVNNAIVDEDGSPLYENGIAAFSAGKSEINIYVDQYDFVIYVSGVETPKNYAAVIGVGKSNQYGSETRGVTLLLPDNTKKEVTAWSDEWTKMVATNGTTVGTFPAKGTDWENLVTDALADVVTYSVGSDGVYTLKLAGVGYKQDKVSFTNGRSAITIGGKTLYTTSKTIFMIASKDGDACNYGVYTGYAAAPGLDSSKVNGVAYATNRYYTNQIDVVYIDADDVIGLASYTYFVKPEKPAVYTIEGQKYCTLNAVVDGEVITIDIDATLLEGKAAGLYAITNIKKDNDTNIIARCDYVANSVAFKATSESTNKGVKGTIGANGQVLGFGLLKGDTEPAYWAYNDSTKVYTIDKDYKTITASDVKSVPTAEDDLAFAAHDNGNPNKKLTNVFIVEDGAKGAAPTPDATYTVTVPAELQVAKSNKGPWSSEITGVKLTDTIYIKAADGATVTTVKVNDKMLSSPTKGVWSFTMNDVKATESLVADDFETGSDLAGKLDTTITGLDITWTAIVTGGNTYVTATLNEWPDWVPEVNGTTIKGKIAATVNGAVISDISTTNGDVTFTYANKTDGKWVAAGIALNKAINGDTIKLSEVAANKFIPSAVKVEYYDGDNNRVEGRLTGETETLTTTAAASVAINFTVSDGTGNKNFRYTTTGTNANITGATSSANDNVAQKIIKTGESGATLGVGSTDLAANGDTVVKVTIAGLEDVAETLSVSGATAALTAGGLTLDKVNLAAMTDGQKTALAGTKVVIAANANYALTGINKGESTVLTAKLTAAGTEISGDAGVAGFKVSVVVNGETYSCYLAKAGVGTAADLVSEKNGKFVKVNDNIVIADKDITIEYLPVVAVKETAASSSKAVVEHVAGSTTYVVNFANAVKVLDADLNNDGTIDNGASNNAVVALTSATNNAEIISMKLSEDGLKLTIETSKPLDTAGAELFTLKTGKFLPKNSNTTVGATAADIKLTVSIVSDAESWAIS